MDLIGYKNLEYIKKHNSIPRKYIKKSFLFEIFYFLKNLKRDKIDYKVDFTNKFQIMDTKYFPENIQKYILNTTFIRYNFTIYKNNYKFDINIYSLKKIKIKKYIKYIQTTIELCNHYKPLTINSCIDIYLTPFDKYMDQDIISSKHINSALTLFYHNKKSRRVLIYRKEEWFKVFIHECFHLFSLDFRMNEETSLLFSNLFYMNSDYLLFESYVEFWARIIHMCICLFYKYKTWKIFQKYFNRHLQLEKIYSVLSCNKLLSQYDYSIDNIKTHKKQWNENTNAFCYYVVTSILLFKFENTIEFFQKYNHNLLNFNETNCKYFIEYIQNILDEYISYYHSIKHFNIDKINMSHFEISF